MPFVNFSKRGCIFRLYKVEERFVRNANLMLDAVLVFWRGLDFQRAALAAEGTINAKAG